MDSGAAVRDVRETPMIRVNGKLRAGLSFATVCISLNGCTSTHQTYDESGSVSHMIGCHKWNYCLQRAGALCKTSGYRIQYQNELDGMLMVSCMRGK